MSYILDALRKSEQQRQATQPDNVTDRLSLNQAQPVPKMGKWLKILLVGNFLVLVGMAWLFLHKTEIRLLHHTKVFNDATQQTQAVKSVASPSQPDTAPEPIVKAQVDTTLQSLDQAKASTPSIAQMLEQKQQAEKKVGTSASLQLATTPKPQTAKKERLLEKSNPMKNGINYQTIESSKAVASATQKNVRNVMELPYERRNKLPRLTINVFSYAQNPQDRFVIIDMVKYKVGQMVQGTAQLKEIRPDSIVLQSHDGTFTVDRP